MVVIATLLIIGALASLAVGLDLGPTRRVSRRRKVTVGLPADTARPVDRVASALDQHVGEAVTRRGWLPLSSEQLEIAGIMTAPERLVVLTLLAAAAAAALVHLVAGAWILTIAVLVLVPTVAVVVARWRLGRTQRQFADQLPAALRLMASTLRSGHSMERVLDTVGRESDAPLGPELMRAVNETRLGRDLVEALEDVGRRMASDDLDWVAAALAIQRETGGNLNEVLDRVALTILERQHLRQQIMSLSAEGRLSAVILMALPVLMGAYYSIAASRQMGIFLDSTIGILLLIGSGLLYLVGGLWMRSIVRIDF